jgi:AAA ATPase domain
VAGVFDQYRGGLDSLAKSATAWPRQDRMELDSLRGRLLANLAVSERDGDTEQHLRERNDILHQVTCLAWRGEPRQSYKGLCGLGVSYAGWRTARPDLSPDLRAALFQRTTDDESRSIVGREWLFSMVNELVCDTTADGGSGYVFIQGAPGIGKTAIAAALVGRERWVHHYVGDDVLSAEQCLRSLCAQLIVTYGLDHEGALFNEQEPSRPLFELLASAASQPAIRPIVVLLDALDQISEGPGSVRLPRDLPAGTCMIVTTRPLHGSESPPPLKNKTVLRLDSEEYKSRNDDDIRRYAEHFIQVSGARMRQRIASFGTDSGIFTAQLVERSAGNFLYAVYLLKEVLGGTIGLDQWNGRHLPDGLTDYYWYWWRRMKQLAGREEFARLHEPVLAVLALLPQPLSDRQLMRYTGQSWADLTEVLRRWYPFFFQVSGDGGARRTALFHSSFRDFLNTEAVQDGLDLELYDQRIFGNTLQDMGLAGDGH